MGLVRQYQQIEPVWPTFTIPAPQNTRLNSRHAMQILDVNLERPCRLHWVSTVPADQVISNPRRTRGLLVLKSSGPIGSSSFIPAVTSTTNCSVELLDEWDSNEPANFGGDIHGWWKVYYVIPDDFDQPGGIGPTWNMEVVSSGSFKHMRWFSTDEDIEPSGGTFGDGVDIEFERDLFYGGSGVLVNPTSVDVTSQFGDLVMLYSAIKSRTFDDQEYELTFEHGSNAFSLSETYVNGIPEPIRVMLGDPQDDDLDHTITLRGELRIFPTVLTGSARGLNTQFGVRLRAACDE